MKKVIIGIHGLGNKPKETLLHAWWLNALHEGLERIGKPRKDIPFKMVYWADISYSEPLDPEITDSANPLFLREPYAAGDVSSPSRKGRKLRIRVLNFIEKHIDRLFLKKNPKEPL